MYTCRIENKNGAILSLTGQESVYQVLKITGLNPAPAQVNTSTIVGLDGAVYNSSRVGMRNIVILLKINGDVEANRLALYQYVRPKEQCRVYFKHGSRDVYIDGYVEGLECDWFSNATKAQISVLCPYPYFSDVSETEESVDAQAGAVLLNGSETECGAEFEVEFSTTGGAVVSSFTITNTTTGKHLELSNSDGYANGDVLKICTIDGRKAVSLVSGGEQTNAFGDVQEGSAFFKLASGNNALTYSAEVGGSVDNSVADVTAVFREVYEGV